MQWLPSTPLSGIVRHFLWLDSAERSNSDHLLFSDGCPGMIFHLGDPFGELAAPVDQAAPGLNFHPRSFFYGQLSTFHRVKAMGRLALLAVVLQPYSVHTLTGIPAQELTDQLLPLSDIWGAAADILQEKIMVAPDPLTRIRYIESFLLKKIQQHTGPDQLVKGAVCLIQQQFGQLPVTRLNQMLGTGERQLERIFVGQVGLSPKYYSGVVRLQHFLKLLRTRGSRTGESLTTLAYECGYYDQAHLIREFHKHVGMAPLRYRQDSQQLAVNFIRLHPAFSV
jgi:AraC-like DNA-binding protein